MSDLTGDVTEPLGNIEEIKEPKATASHPFTVINTKISHIKCIINDIQGKTYEFVLIVETNIASNNNWVGNDQI